MRKNDVISIIIVGALMIAAITLCFFAFGQPEQRVVEIELETTATQSQVQTEVPEESETTGAVVDTAPAETEAETVPATEAVTEAVTETETEVMLTYGAGEGYLDVPFSHEEQDIVRVVSEEYGMPFALTMAIIYTESGFDRYAYSSHGDCGLMQIAPVNHGWLAEAGLTDLWDVEQNVRAGLTILSDKLKISGGDFTTALMRYNRGDAVALEQMRQGIFSTDYTDRVLGKYYEYLNYGG